MFKGMRLWKYLIKRAAKAYDLLDPFSFLARMQRFSEPSEVQEPIELLRAGILFHARGLINTKAIQHNLDWIWPYWVERQFDPRDVSFIPRAFSFSHVNLTHRNWTTLGLPDAALYPIVDPRGLVTPFYDGWSLDFWLVHDDQDMLLPSRLPQAKQYWQDGDCPAIATECEKNGMQLISQTGIAIDNQQIKLVISMEAKTENPGWLVLAVRPYNSEGIQFIEDMAYNPGSRTLSVNGVEAVFLENQPERVCFSRYQDGDVLRHLNINRIEQNIHCETGMATGAILYPAEAGHTTRIRMKVPLEAGEGAPKAAPRKSRLRSWPEVLSGTAALRLPDPHLQQLYETAVRSVIHLTADEPFPGPYTYKRFWYRDACFMLHALLGLGMEERCRRLLEQFPKRQQSSGYYHSQNGEWDSNGQVLWLVNRFEELSDLSISDDLLESIFAGADWIRRKRRETSGRHTGLLPPGFSAEHFGPNDFYYWDDFWAVAGLQGAARLARRHGKKERHLEKEAQALFKTVIASIGAAMEHRHLNGMPASPKRRLDAGAIGCLVADYPLQLFDAGHDWVRGTIDFLLEHCMQQGGFFQDIIHSGINVYLTLDMAQTLLRLNDSRHRELIKTVAGLASPTGQWPEAIHPLTGGGCMGDGQHGWAAAEWMLMMRSLFVRQEGSALVIGSGLFPEWLEQEDELFFGPTPTPFGKVSVRVNNINEIIRLTVEGQWRDQGPQLIVEVPGHKAQKDTPEANRWILLPEKMNKQGEKK